MQLSAVPHDLPSILAAPRQHGRLLTLSTVQQSDLPESLVVERFHAREAINELFRFDIDALSIATDLDLSSFLGEEITLRLLQPDGSRRAWHGFCTDARWLGADGGLARYRLRLEPGLAFLRYRRDCFLFQDKHVADIITELLADYPQVRFHLDVTQPLAVRAVCTQYRETDLAFLLRLLASEGLSFRFVHAQDGDEAGTETGKTSASSASGADAATHARHALVIFDSDARAPDVDGGRNVRFHGIRATECDDAINRFSARREVQPNAVALSSWNPAILHATAAEQVSVLNAGELPVLAVHDGSGAERFADGDAAERQARLTLAALELGNKSFHGAGSVRRLAAGHVFTLAQHDHYPPGNDAFTVLWVEHEGANNLDAHNSAAAAALSGGLGDTFSSSGISAPLQRGTYRNSFGCVREAVPIVPPATAACFPPTAPGPQTALVVGLPDAVLTSNRDHQVKVQFPWQRGSRPLAGGLTDTGNAVDTEGNAPGDDTSGSWVRVAEALAGPSWGSCFVPRIGTEVIVDFIEGDIDRPVIVGQLYNSNHLPPYAAGVDSGINHAGVISGWHSRTLDGNGYNQWVIDDTQGQLRMRLATSCAASQLNLGYLIAQSPGSARREAYRGEGFEWRTDGWGVIRAGEGLLITTAARPALGASVTSTQMDAAESVALLKGAQDLTQRLSQTALQQAARVSQDANDAQQAFIRAIDPEQDGKYTGAVNGQAPFKDAVGSREADAPVEKFARPLMLLDAQATMNCASPASSVLFAGGQVHWTTQGDVQMTAGHTASEVAGHAATLFTQQGGMQAIAANGPVSLAAHTDRLEMLADREVVVQSVNGHITIGAQKKIEIVVGDAAVVLEGKNITFTCPGQFTAKGGQRLFNGPAAKAAVVERLPNRVVPADPPEHSLFVKYDEQIAYKDSHTEPMSDLPFRVQNNSDTERRLASQTPEQGDIERIDTPEAQPLEYALRYAAFNVNNRPSNRSE